VSRPDEALVRLRELPRVECLQGEAAKHPEHDPSSVEAFLAITTVAADLQAHLEDRFVEHGLSRGRLTVLMLLRHAEGGASTPAELAHKASVTTATMTGLLDGLEAQGLLRRVHREDDRRSLRIELTAGGRQRLERFLPGHWGAIKRLMGRLTRAEQKTLTGLLVKLIAPAEARAPRPRRAARSAGSD
jgi:DNA-binding MarR family transcriptional regulator